MISGRPELLPAGDELPGGSLVGRPKVAGKLYPQANITGQNWTGVIPGGWSGYLLMFDWLAQATGAHNGLACHVQAGAGAGRMVRLLLGAIGADGSYGDVIADTGPIEAAATGRLIGGTSTFALSAGRCYWAGAIVGDYNLALRGGPTSTDTPTLHGVIDYSSAGVPVRGRAVAQAIGGAITSAPAGGTDTDKFILLMARGA